MRLLKRIGKFCFVTPPENTQRKVGGFTIALKMLWTKYECMYLIIEINLNAFFVIPETKKKQIWKVSMNVDYVYESTNREIDKNK